MKRRHKRMLLKIIVLLLLFISAVAIVFALSHREVHQEPVIMEMEEASLPIVEVEIDGHYMNRMHGYTGEMVDRYMRDTVTPLESDRRLKLRILTDKDKVESVRYEIRSLDTTQLVENTEVENWQSDSDNSVLQVELPIQNLLEKGKEYQLQLILETGKHDTVTYYTRILFSDSLYTGEMIQFVEEFHEKTMNTSKASGMASYLKPTTDTSTSLGKVTLNSSYKKLLWNYLNPKQVAESDIYLTDINSSIGTFRMESQVKFTDENSISHLCDVEEIFTVQVSNGYWYMLGYERTVNEKLDAKAIDVKNKRIELGIIDDNFHQVLNSEDGMCQAFVLNGEVWLSKGRLAAVKTEEGESKPSSASCQNSLIRIFSFEQDTPDVRADYKEHDLKLVSLDNQGNLSFLLYGYMNSGIHEGEVGLTFYHYNTIENYLEESFYLPFDKSYEILKEEIGQLSYVNRSELFYLMLNGRIYAIDFAGREYMTIVEKVADDSLVINADSSVIAWEEDRSQMGAGRIQILYLDDGHQNTVNASEGEYLHAAGFIDEDLVIGKIKENHYKQYHLQTQTPMYALEVIGKNGLTAAKYQKDNILITDTQLENNGIILKRSRIKRGVLHATSDDALIENVNQTTAAQELLVTASAAEGYRKWFLMSALDKPEQEIVKISKICVTDSSYLRISLSGVAEDGMYFAYSKGKLQAICSTISEAVNLVYDDIGYVTDSSGHYVMRRGYRGYNMLGISSSQTASGWEERRNLCMQTFAAYEGGRYSETFEEMEEAGRTDLQMLQSGMNAIAYDLSGCTLSQIVYYYIGHQHPIYAETVNGAVLITGAGSENVYIWNPQTGQTDAMSLLEAQAMFEEAGNVFYSCMNP